MSSRDVIPMTSWRRLSGWCALAMSALLLCNQARAQETTSQAEARAHFDRGLELVDAKRFEEAAAAFQRAQSLRPHAAVLYNLGMAQAAARQPAAALLTFEAYQTSPEASQDYRRARAVRAHIESLQSKVGKLRLELVPNDASVRIDGRITSTVAPQRLDPGSHSLSISAPGYLTTERDIVIGEGEEKVLSIELERDEAAAAAGGSPRVAAPVAANRPSVQLRPRSVSAGRSVLRHEPSRAVLASGRTSWMLPTLSGTGALLAGATVGVVLDNNARHSEWRSEDRAIAEALRAPQPDDGLSERRRANDTRAERIKLQDEIAVGLGVASAITLLAAAAWWILDLDLTRASPSVASRHGVVALDARF